MINLVDGQKNPDRRICLLVPDGRGVRSFVLGPFLGEAARRCRIDVFHGINDDALPEYRAGLDGEFAWHPLIPLKERPVSFTLRQGLCYAQMYWVGNFPMRRKLSQPIHGSWRSKAAHRAARIVGRAAASQPGIRVLDRLQTLASRRLPEVRQYRERFKETRPQLLFSSLHDAPQILAPVIAARSLHIPTVAFIRSWDNLSSKGRIAAPFDHLLVWGDQMRRDLLQFYPDVSSQQIHMVGTPQFDPYADVRLRSTREEFCRQIGANPDRPLICYSGGVAHIAPEDPRHAATLMQLIRDGLIGFKPQVVLRPSPCDRADRFDEVRGRYPELLFAPPACRNAAPGDWMAVIPRIDDIRFMANLTCHADLNINFASTMTLDFAACDKPVINVAFDVSSPPRFGMPMWEYYQKWHHYRPVIELGAARFARSPKQLARQVNAYLANPALDREQRAKLIALQLGASVGASSERIMQTLETVMRMGTANGEQGRC